MFSSRVTDDKANDQDVTGIGRSLKRILPRSLLGRSLLIVLVPLLVTQSIVLALFYGTYLNLVSRRLADGVTGEIMLVTHVLEEPLNDQNRVYRLSQASAITRLGFSFQPAQHLGHEGTNHVFGPMDDDLARALGQRLERRFSVEWLRSRRLVIVSVQMQDGVLVVRVPKKRLSIEPIWVFVVWVFGSSMLLFLIASVFMRNQVQAIRRLARAAELFGLGRDAGAIRPQGAWEVRRAATAFNRMRERVNRFVSQRTNVLAGVSHDLRTPLARLRLSLAMLPTQGDIRADALQSDITDMVQDVADMERLIESYLSFARGEGAEKPAPADVRALLEDVASATMRSGGYVLGVEGNIGQEVIVRSEAMRRALTNLADNARRHGGRMRFALRATERRVEITVEDDGPGLEIEDLQRIENKLAAGERIGSGLGLSIVRDVIHAHGGFVRLETSPLGGLRVILSFPR